MAIQERLLAPSLLTGNDRRTMIAGINKEASPIMSKLSLKRLTIASAAAISFVLSAPAIAETSWDLPPANQPVNQSRRVHLPKPGVYRVGVSAILPLGDSARFVDSAMLFLIVEQNATVAISEKDPNAVSPMGSIMPESGFHEVQAAAINDPNADPCVTVRGVIQRIERTPTRGGYAADRLVPVRSALVEVREEDTLFDDSYGETLTDAQGRYSFSFCDDDCLFASFDR